MPYLQQIMNKRDPYSHLAVKALLNGGLPGLKIVLDSLNGSKDPDFDRKMLKDAKDHVSYDEETEAYLKKYLESAPQNSAGAEFAKATLDDFKLEESVNSTEEEDKSSK